MRSMHITAMGIIMSDPNDNYPTQLLAILRRVAKLWKTFPLPPALLAEIEELLGNEYELRLKAQQEHMNENATKLGS